jgi:hypothetical protein
VAPAHPRSSGMLFSGNLPSAKLAADEEPESLESSPTAQRPSGCREHPLRRRRSKAGYAGSFARTRMSLTREHMSHARRLILNSSRTMRICAASRTSFSVELSRSDKHKKQRVDGKFFRTALATRLASGPRLTRYVPFLRLELSGREAAVVDVVRVEARIVAIMVELRPGRQRQRLHEGVMAREARRPAASRCGDK